MKSSQLYIPASKARNDFFNLLEKVKKGPYPIHITVKGVPEAVIMSEDEYEGWMATIETLSDPELMDGIKEAEEDMKAGRYYPWEEVKKELGLDKLKISDVKSKYVPSRSKQSSKKRSKKA